MKNLISQGIPIPIQPPPGSRLAPGPTAGDTFGGVISATIGVLTIVAAIWLLFNIITGGIDIINSGGDKQKLSDAKGKITNSVVGLVLVIAAFLLVQFIGLLLGIQSPLDVTYWITTISNAI